jgi:hypothetical protein
LRVESPGPAASPQISMLTVGVISTGLPAAGFRSVSATEAGLYLPHLWGRCRRRRGLSLKSLPPYESKSPVSLAPYHQAPQVSLYLPHLWGRCRRRRGLSLKSLPPYEPKSPVPLAPYHQAPQVSLYLPHLWGRCRRRRGAPTEVAPTV